MPRIRTVKPELFRHEELQDIEEANPGSHAMLTFIGLFTASDKNGCFPWRPRQLKLDILPFLSNDIETTLELLLGAGLLQRFKCEDDDRDYGVIVNFRKHQRINGKEAQEPPRYPPPPQQGSNGEAPEKQLPAQEREREREREKISPPTPLGRGEAERDPFSGIEKDEDGFPPGGGEKGDYRRHSKKIRDYLATKFWEELESAGRTNCNDIPGQASKRLSVLFGRYTWDDLLLAWERYTDANKYNVVDGKEYRLSMQKFMRDEEIRQWLDMPEKAFRRILEGHAKKNQHEGKLHYGETYAISS